MKAKNSKRILSLVLSLALLVSMFSMCLVSVSAADTDVLLDNAQNGFANWSDSIAEDGTLQEGMKGSLLTVNDGVWPENKTVQSVTFDLTATVQSAQNRYVGFVYYYEDANNYKMLQMRETGVSNGQLLYLGLVDYIDGVKSAPSGITHTKTPKGSIIDTSINGNTEISVGATSSAIVTVSYIDSDNVNIKISSADGASSFTVAIADDTADATDIDFKDAAKQKFYFVVANDSAVVYKTNSIKVQFDKDLTISGNSITDNAANGFEHFSTYIAADGSVNTQNTAFSMNQGVWPQGKQLKSVEMNLTAKMNGDGEAYMRLIYDYTDAQNYKTLTFRESGSDTSTTHLLYHGLVDIENGTAKSATNVTATNGVKAATSAGINSNTQVGFLTGTNIKIEYLDSSNVKFTFTDKSTAVTFTTTVTAASGSGLDFKGVSEQFYMLFTSNVSNIKFTDITVEWEKSAADDIAEFKEKYADILVDVTASAYLANVRAALAEYEAASAEVKAGLAEEYAQLKANFTAIIVEAGSYSTDFENGTDYWEQYADFTDKNGNPIVQDDIDVEALGSDRTGGISQNESGNILVADTTITADAYTQAAKEDDNAWAINAVMMLSPARSIWTAAKAAEKNFASAEFDLYVNVGGNTAGILVYYNYVDNNNFSYFRIKRGSGGLETVNIVIGLDEETGNRVRKHTSSTTIRAFNNWSVNANNWIRVRIAYDENNKAILTTTGEAGDTYTLTSNDAVAKENRMFAIGSSIYSSSDQTMHAKSVIDNFSMIIANAETQEGVDFETKYAETLSLSTERFAAYDAKEVDIMAAAYEALSDKGKSSLKAETVAAVEALKAARALWDTTSDETVVQSYKAIWGEKIATDTEKAWNVYNRLTAAQKALLSDEYNALVSAMSAKTQVTDDTVNINCVGDSITFGSGSTSVATYSYPSQMQALLGDGYTVSRNGIAGIAVVKSYTVSSPDEVQLGMAGSTEWANSHKGTDDIIIIQLGTNDLSQVAGKSAERTALYKAGYEKLIQSYLRLENSPLVIISNTPVSYSSISNGYAETYSTIAKINMEMAAKYGLPCVDMHAYTNAYTDEEVATYYATDKLHPSNEGYTKMAQVFYDAVKSLDTTFDTADVTAYTFDENALNSFLAPEMLGATIKKADNTAAQHLGFRTKVSKIVKTGASIVEYGTIFAKYKADDEAEILEKMVYSETADETNAVAYARGFNADVAGYEYIAGLSCADMEAVKEAYITRAYVKYSDGTVYYSVNNYKDATSYSERKGVINGYASRSVVSIAKEMVKLLAKNDIVDSNVATYDSGTDTLTFTETAKADYDVVFSFLVSNADNIARLS